MQVQKVKVENAFSRKVRQRGGRTKIEAIQRADATVEKTKPKYHDWVAEYIMQLEALFTKAKSSQDFDMRSFDAAYLKAAHIRNLGGTFGNEMTTAVADRLCELLYRLMDLGFCHGPAVSALFDALKLVTSKEEFQGVSSKIYAGFLAELDKVMHLFPPVVAEDEHAPKKSRSIH